jgi:L-amino acid N-acyltransferase YncA
LTVTDAVLLVSELFPSVPQTPPHVSALLAHGLKSEDPIFESFREDYPGFDNWLSKCKREHRQAWVIQARGRYAGVCIVKPELPAPYGLTGKVLKICAFKIAHEFRGYRYGELLLKTVFQYLVKNEYTETFVTVLPKYQELIDMLSDFGFTDIAKLAREERVFCKKLRPEPGTIPALDFNIKYGPHALTLGGAQVFAIPIQPHYHELLFPEFESQLSLATESHPFGNSIRKAYLCHANVRQVLPGDVLLFYRSGDLQGVIAIGVAEATLVSSSPSAIAHFVGRRTVYSYAEIERMAEKPVLAILFRFARALTPPWTVDVLTANGIIKRAPQSIMQVKSEAIPWIAKQLAVPY